MEVGDIHPTLVGQWAKLAINVINLITVAVPPAERHISKNEKYCQIHETGQNKYRVSK